jgi:flagellar motor switch protein FliM
VNESLHGESEIPAGEDAANLLAQAAEESIEAFAQEPEADGARERLPRSLLKPHDFRTPTFIAPRQWTQLRREQESFAEALAGRLSNEMRLEFTVRLASLDTTPFGDFVKVLPEPALLVLFKVEPLRGICLLDITPQFGLAMVDRLLGGPGQGPAAAQASSPASSSTVPVRDLSEIEIALLDQVLQVILTEWCQHWARVQDLRPAILGHENSARFLQLAPGDSLFLVVGLEVRWGDFTEQMRLAFPCHMLEPLLRQITPALPKETPPPAPSQPTPKWNPKFASVLVPVSAEWPARQLNARDVARLRVGDVLEWDPAAATSVRVLVAAAPKFIGRLGTRNGHWAIEVQSACTEPQT